jgi:hypothetical protein
MRCRPLVNVVWCLSTRVGMYGCSLVANVLVKIFGIADKTIEVES